MPKHIKSIKFIKPGIGYLPSLQPHVINGFSWGKNSGNMSFNYGEFNEVLKNVKNFFKALNIGRVEDSVHMGAQHGDTIVDITQDHIDKIKANPENQLIECDAFFTKLPDVTLTIKPADCTTALIYALNQNRERIIGIVHSGRIGVSLEVPRKAVEFLVKTYSCDPTEIKIGIPPHLSQKNRKFEHIDGVENKKVWEGFIEEKDGFFYLGAAECTIDQYIKSGVKEENIEVYDVDTFEAAQRGETFSHKYCVEMEKKGKDIPEQRMIVAIRMTS